MKKEWSVVLLGLVMAFFSIPAPGQALDNLKVVTRAPVDIASTVKLPPQDVISLLLPRQRLSGTLGDYAAEPRNKNGRVDVPRLLSAIQAAHMNMHDFLIWRAKTDWEDCQAFAAQARQRHCKVWITLVPPSEPPASQPFGADYIRWADEIGKLSQKNDNIAGVVIDDFWTPQNRSLFTPQYAAKFAATLRRHNPGLAFLPTIYWKTVGDKKFIKDFASSIDGIMFPYADLQSAKNLPSQLDACRKWLGPGKLLFVNVYATGSSGTGEKGPRSTQYLRDMLSISREKSDGIRVYLLPKADLKDYRFTVTADLFGKWNSK
jgi:hypothetical protein